LSEADKISRLSEFGLSFDESTIFYLLTRTKKSGFEWITGRDLARIANRDRVRVYQILNRLIKLGLIRANFSRPIGYSAISPETALNKLISIHESKLTKLNQSEREMADALTKAEPIQMELQENGQNQTSSALTMFHGLSGITRVIREEISGKNLEAILNRESLLYLLTTSKSLREKPRNGKIIFSRSGGIGLDRSDQDMIKVLNFEISYIKRDLPTILISSDQVIFLFYSHERYKPKPLSQWEDRQVMLHGLSISYSGYVEEAHNLFQMLWAEANLSEEISVPESNPLPNENELLQKSFRPANPLQN